MQRVRCPSVCLSQRQRWPAGLLLSALLAGAPTASRCELMEETQLRLYVVRTIVSGSVAEWIACWTQTQKGLGSNRSRDAVG